MIFRIWFPILAFAALSIGASWALSGCADLQASEAARTDYALDVLRHEKATLNGWTDHPTQLLPPPEYDYEPKEWHLAVIDDTLFDVMMLTQCSVPPSERQRQTVVACTSLVNKTTLFRQSYSTPLIQAIAAQHAPGKTQ